MGKPIRVRKQKKWVGSVVLLVQMALALLFSRLCSTCWDLCQSPLWAPFSDDATLRTAINSECPTRHRLQFASNLLLLLYIALVLCQMVRNFPFHYHLCDTHNSRYFFFINNIQMNLKTVSKTTIQLLTICAKM